MQSTSDHVVHVVVPVLGQAAAENHVLLCFCQFGVSFVELLIALVVDGVVSFLSRLPVGRVFFGNVGDGLRAELEMFVLDDAGVRRFAVGVIHDSDALMIDFFQALGLKAQSTVFQPAELVIEIGVDRPGVHDCLGAADVLGTVFVVVDVQLHFDAVEQRVDQLVVAADGDVLVPVIEVVVVESVAQGQAADDERGQLGAAARPHYFSV